MTPSVEHRVRPCSIASAARCASGTRRLVIPGDSSRDRSIAEWSAPGSGTQAWPLDDFLDVTEQLGNIGSEVSRAARWRARNPELAQSAFYRALELIDFTLDDPRHRRSRARLRELTRTREVLVDFFAGEYRYGSTAESLQKYFDAFALAARRT